MTYNVELTDKPDKRGIHHVMIRLHAKGQKPARIQTSIEIEARHWNTKKTWGKWIRSSHPHAGEVNNAIIATYNKVKKSVEEYLAFDPFLTPKQGKARYEASAITLLRAHMSAAHQFVDLSGVTKATRNRQWAAFLRWAGEDLAIEQITPQLVEDYKNKLLADGKAPLTINTYMANLRVLYERVQKARNIPKADILAKSPFLDWEKLPPTQMPKGRLPAAAIAKLLATPFDLGSRRVRSRTFRNYPDWARWCWLACHLQAGMRIGDLIRSRYEWYEVNAEGQPVRLRYQMQKNGKWISIPVSKQLQAHLGLIWKAGSRPETYLLPFLDNQATYARYRSYEQMRSMPPTEFKQLKSRLDSITCQLNLSLKQVAIDFNLQLPGGASFTNHTARHSFADKVRLAIKNGKTDAKGRAVTNFDAKELLGHTDMKTTEMYFGEMDQEWLDSAMDAITGDD
ncbi:tyrosine-type recombinase/integrase [Spirosoma endbachense]|uniref:Core-binding (CB) domain-containing protein n=1 Tax=Spirosoma endbachense TaxID=2666025 RepID=A0A6P1VWX4_9BACT|nr:phage integrase N-terminal SAM-like domain-containing protein [Spirosoma endbachense]QHV96340.1 hypothetical protein GJR95_15510 [Spirosoma endbachense]